jgi:hypothetical protein
VGVHCSVKLDVDAFTSEGVEEGSFCTLGWCVEFEIGSSTRVMQGLRVWINNDADAVSVLHFFPIGISFSYGAIEVFWCWMPDVL